MKSITIMAQEVWEDEFLEDPSYGLSLGIITGWMESSLGKVNISLHQAYEPEDNDDPVFDDGGAEVYKMMYISKYYTGAAQKALRGIMDESVSAILSVKDDDTIVTKINKSEVGKTMRAIAKDYQDELRELVHQHKIHYSPPKQIFNEDC